MKGDLHTLKKVCSYGSRAMFIGTVVLIVLAVAFSAVGACSFFSRGADDLLNQILSTDCCTEPVVKGSSFIEILFLLVLGAVSVYVTFLVMRSVATEHSPFNESNTKPVITLSQIYLVSAVVFAVLEVLASKQIATILFLFFGCILVSVILYVLALIIRYGAVLQTESDHTL